MIRSLRRLHFRLMVALALLGATVLVAALGARRPFPTAPIPPALDAPGRGP